MKEIWRDVPKWDTYYEVSNLGRVRSLDRCLKVLNNQGKVHIKFFKGKILSPTIKSKGYLAVNLVASGKRRQSKCVHQLVLLAFVGGRIESFHACHNNGNRIDNRLLNLRWDTAKSNMLDRSKHGKWNYRKGTKTPWAKLSWQQVNWIRKNYNLFTYREMGLKFGLSASAVYKVAKNQTYHK